LIQDLLAAFGGVLGLCTGFRKTQKMVKAVQCDPPPPFLRPASATFLQLEVHHPAFKSIHFNGNPKPVNLDLQILFYVGFVSLFLCVKDKTAFTSVD
jgi:hypothetical protein